MSTRFIAGQLVDLKSVMTDSLFFFFFLFQMSIMTLKGTGSTLKSLKSFLLLLLLFCMCTHMQISEDSPSAETTTSSRLMEEEKCMFLYYKANVFHPQEWGAGECDEALGLNQPSSCPLFLHRQILHICTLKHISVTLPRANSLLRIITSEQQIINLDVSLFTWTNTGRLCNLMA